MLTPRNVVFVAPFLQETTLRLLKGVVDLPNTRVGLVSQDPEARLPAEIRGLLNGHYGIADGLDPNQIEQGVRAMGREFGSVDRLIGALEELQVPLGDVRDNLGIEGMGGEVARNFRDKGRMKSVLQQHGLPCARHRTVDSAAGARAFAAEVGFPLVAKPPEGSGARSTFRLENDGELAACLRAMPPGQGDPLLLEEFVIGEEASFDSVCLGGRMIWHSISHYSPTPLEVLREPWIQWCVCIPREVEHPAYPPIVQAASAALPILGLQNGLSHMEWFQRPDRSVAISEVGARPPGAQFTKLISYAHDFDLYRSWGELMVYDRFEPRSRPYSAGAAYLRGQGMGRVETVTGLDEIFTEFGDLIVEHRVPQSGQPQSSSYEGQGYVIVRHPETKVVERALRAIVQKVRVVLTP